MASHEIKIHEQCNVPPHPPSSTHQVPLPLTFFDLFWLRIHPVERIFFYTLHSSPSFLFEKVVPKLKSSLSFTLQHFLPLAGNIVWPSDSDKPVVQYKPGDGVSLVIAESDADFDIISNKNSPREASESHSFVPNLDSSDTLASAMSLQITLFPNRGFSIGISTHHAVIDGKSSIMFSKAWASLCQSSDDDEESSPSLVPELKPFFDRKVFKELELSIMNSSSKILSMILPNQNRASRCLKILPSEPNLEDSVRAAFVLTREDLEKVKKRVLSKWDMVDDDNREESMIHSSNSSKPPPTLSTFVLVYGYVCVCIAKAIHGIENEKQRFGFAFMVDCRNRLEPPIPDAYFGNCVAGVIIDAEPEDFIKEDGVVLIAKSIHKKIKTFNDNDGFKIDESDLERYGVLAREEVQIMTVAGSNRFGVYGIDLGFGKPEKVEIVSLDRGLSIGLAENKDVEKGGIEIGLVLKKNVMDLFRNLFEAGLSEED